MNAAFILPGLHAAQFCFSIANMANTTQEGIITFADGTIFRGRALVLPLQMWAKLASTPA